MSLISYLSTKYTDVKEKIVWTINYGGLGNLLFMPYWILMRRERGTEFPFYFPDESKILMDNVEKVSDLADDFLNCHETERNNVGDYNKTFTERLWYVINNFHIYSNDTMCNLYFSEKLPERDYQKIRHVYNQLALGFFAYNVATNIFIIAMNNFVFRGRKTSIPMAAVASVPAMLAIGVNFNVSYSLFDRLLSVSVRRHGYEHLLHRYKTRYRRNVDFTTI